MDYKMLLNELLSSLKLSKKKFAEQLGLSQGNVSDWFNRPGYRPSIDALKRISEIYNVNLNWLITGKGDMFNSTHARENPPGAGVLTIPVYADIAAGIGIEAEDLEPTESISIPSEAITNIPGPFYCFRVNGVSMEPELHTGDYAIISGWQFDVDYNGYFCAFRSVDGLLIKRLVYDHRCKRCLLVPVNPTHPIIEYDEHSPDIKIIGRLVAVLRKYI
ncbi:MAG: S24 family peptidase [Candidatus Cloacimonetes bacterium]|jgi:SOS-response transcriptional repressor LexA|nr:helix-turn-helix domain-containing protein [Candidatus Cloacimonadota bacterium]MDD2506059.1 S24 family peptidase [Candidatus Cloacimonadota bacterium]MDD4559551.1 S24 family peptidase [Candidatus Cloacimonadota bacterium]